MGKPLLFFVGGLLALKQLAGPMKFALDPEVVRSLKKPVNPPSKVKCL